MPNPDNILAAHQLAASLRAQADLILARARHLGTAGASLRWHSHAADVFRPRLHDTIGLLLHTAARYDASADEITALAMVS